MLPLQSLLNPAPPNGRVAGGRQETISPLPPPPCLGPDATAGFRPGVVDAHLALRRALPRSAGQALCNKTTRTTQGPVRFPPFEHLDEDTLREVTRYQVKALGQIQHCCEHIPYNSAKKDFFEKTGRESIEAFSYEFCVPGQSSTYKVMWDYNIGLVRMTPFFKCLGYAKMLDKNPGLREISPSITGGSVTAQGYWMPYQCARAVCATFCFEIAGALIPLFGPDFPAACRPPDSQMFGEMTISNRLIASATVEAKASRQAHGLDKAASAGNAGHGRSSQVWHPYLGPPLRCTAAWAPPPVHGSSAYAAHQVAPQAHFLMRSRPAPQQSSGIRLPPLDFGRRERQSFHDYSYRPQSRGAADISDGCDYKRPRADAEPLTGAASMCSHARSKAARLTWESALQPSSVGRVNKDVAAAYGLDTKPWPRRSPPRDCGPAAEVPQVAVLDDDTWAKMRHRANSF
ncbi:hypothetical protein CDD82_3225 [Ophiocordyceps australis]|uniref:HTH APSES-type domain-containing protein n=1 Tax=Ophiocordyceps australis TaxID=1399860 RepID=A0A2C5YYK1_9HYPO|nr:hypothetical protein CDD82_3225 [Ophiocordyceps australis]